MLKCPICGKEFLSKYYDSGYIDHVKNFSEHFNINDIDRIIEQIYRKGNDYRELHDINNRLKCFITFLEQNKADEKTINYVNYTIREKIYYLSNLKKQAEEMQEKISLLTLNDYDASRYIQSFLF